jgi:hypothetical protein
MHTFHQCCCHLVSGVRQKARDASGVSLAYQILSLYCETGMRLRRPLYLMARKFGNSEGNTCVFLFLFNSFISLIVIHHHL